MGAKITKMKTVYFRFLFLRFSLLLLLLILLLASSSYHRLWQVNLHFIVNEIWMRNVNALDEMAIVCDLIPTHSRSVSSFSVTLSHNRHLEGLQWLGRF